MRRIFIFLFSLLIVQQLMAVDFLPEIKKQFKAEGKWRQAISEMKQARARGIDQPFKEAVNLRQLMSGNKTTTYLNALVILVDFTDNIADTVNHQPADFDTLLFSEGLHPSGSMNDFYIENSYGELGVHGLTTIWLRMPQSYAYYVDGQYGFGTYPNNAQKLVEDAVAAADPLVDFSMYDNDNDGTVDALFVIHAGAGREATGSPDDIHSHAWGISNQQRDGVTISGYSMEPELHNNAGEMVRMGVFGHEFGHVLGLPDLYDTDYSSSGLGRWSMMAGGSWNGGGNSPSHFDVWCKTRLGFVTATKILSDAPGLTLPAIEDSAIAYRLWKQGLPGSEYFLVENRQQSGFDSFLPASGMLIFHIDEGAGGNFDDWHPTVMLEQADGYSDLQNGTNSGDSSDPFPGTTSNTAFSAFTSPSSNGYDGLPSFVTVENISASGPAMTADYFVEVSFPILAFSSTVVNDASGDNEDDADPGETVQVSVNVTNTGAASDSVLVTLRSSDPLVTITDSTELITIGASQTQTLTDVFTVAFDSSLQDPSYVIFDLTAGFSSGTFNDHLTLLVGDAPGFATNMEGDPRLWNHYSVSPGYSDEWHRESARNRTLGGQYSFKAGGQGSANYANLQDAALESPDIELGVGNAMRLKFYQKIFAEVGSTAGTAWDGGRIEISDNGGLSWDVVTPDGGYPFTIIDNDQSPFLAGTPVFSGSSTSWEMITADLSAYSGTVRIRFRFGTDGFVNEEGWYIDDVSVKPTVTAVENELSGFAPKSFAMQQNYPNPFNPSTEIHFQMPAAGKVTMSVFDVLGREVARVLDNTRYSAGAFSVRFDASALPSGVYYYRITSDFGSQVRKMVLMK